MAAKKRAPREGPPIVLGLVRVSTEEQAASGAGLASQTSTLHGAADRDGWALELIVEDGVSGKDVTKRPKLIDALDRLDAGHADILAVAKLDRLSRSVIDFATILKRAQKGGWAVVALDLGVDTTTPTGKLVAGIVMQVAEWEREMIALRTTDALAVKKADGVRLGRPDTLDPATRAWITAAFAAVRTPQNIADELNHRKVPTAHGGKKWHASTVRAVLASQAAATMTEGEQ